MEKNLKKEYRNKIGLCKKQKRELVAKYNISKRDLSILHRIIKTEQHLTFILKNHDTDIQTPGN